MQPSFSTRHPFWADLIKRILVITVSWNLIILCAAITFFAGLFFLIMVVTSAGGDSSATAKPDYKPVYGSGQQRLLSLKIDGVIVGSETEADMGLFSDGYVSGYDIKKKLIQAADDSEIMGVVLEINSPGGTIYGSHAIADGITFYKEKTEKPVFAHIQGLGASGGYWAAAAADKVVADFGSEIGSIGVVMGPFQYYNKVLAEDGGLLSGGVVTQNGIETTYITAGTSKDVGNPYRKLSDVEVASLQKSINNEYDNFVNFVAGERKIAPDTIRGQIGAMIYDNKTATELKLIDKTASREDVYHELADEAGVKDDFMVVREETMPGFLQAILGAVTNRQPKQVDFDACSLTRTKLAYHGSVATLCAPKE
jgi:protease IV